ncbi:MAG: peptidoglycan recognition protein family protein [Mycetocola sp.]
MSRRQVIVGAATGAVTAAAAAPGLFKPGPAAAGEGSAERLTAADRDGALAAPVAEPGQDELCAVVFDDASLSRARLRFHRTNGAGGWTDVVRSTHGPDRAKVGISDPVVVPEGTRSIELHPSSTGRVRVVRSNGSLSSGARVSSARRIDFLGLSVVPRSGWGADESLMTFTPIVFSPVQTLTVHHSAMAVSGDANAAVRAIYRLHAVENGWGDIGYQLLIGPDGRIFAGRSTGSDAVPVFDPSASGAPRSSVTGAHAGGFNSGNIGICLMGDFTAAQPTPAARRSLISVLARLCRTRELDPQSTVTYVNPLSSDRRTVSAIARHRDWNATECPGDAFAPTFDRVRADVAVKLRSLSVGRAVS